MNLVHNVRETEAKRGRGRKVKLWSWERTTAWRKVKEVMAAAGLGEGPQVSPKGLRHGFGVAAITSGIPLNMVQKWLGHAQLSTTAIYADAVGAAGTTWKIGMTERMRRSIWSVRKPRSWCGRTPGLPCGYRKPFW